MRVQAIKALPARFERTLVVTHPTLSVFDQPGSYQICLQMWQSPIFDRALLLYQQSDKSFRDFKANPTRDLRYSFDGAIPGDSPILSDPNQTVFFLSGGILTECLPKTFSSLVTNHSFFRRPELRVFAPLSAIFNHDKEDLFAYLRTNNPYQKMLNAAYQAGKISGYEVSIDGQSLVKKGEPTYQLHWLASMGIFKQDARLATLAGLPLASAG